MTMMRPELPITAGHEERVRAISKAGTAFIRRAAIRTLNPHLAAAQVVAVDAIRKLLEAQRNNEAARADRVASIVGMSDQERWRFMARNAEHRAYSDARWLAASALRDIAIEPCATDDDFALRDDAIALRDLLMIGSAAMARSGYAAVSPSST